MNNESNEQPVQIEALERHRRDLEVLVKERTTELADAVSRMQDEISERRRAQKALRTAKRDAEEADRAKSDFLANMSHEIRTPLNAIIGAASMLRRTELQREQLDLVETIRTSGEALLTLIHDILDLSRVESGQVELDRAPFDLRTVIENSLDVATPLAAAKDLELLYVFERGTPETLLGDAARVSQILLNLVGNAVKFTERGKILVTCSAQSRGSRHREVKLAVRDTGSGIASQDLERIFSRFRQLDGSYARHHGGAGLGLAICRHLTALMGGRIWVESTLGEGSTFHFTILGGDAPPGSISPTGLEGRKVLLVDASATRRRCLAEQLRILGVHCHEAQPGSEALESLDSGHCYDLAVLDASAWMADEAQRFERATVGTGLRVLTMISASNESTRFVPTRSATITKPPKLTRLRDTLQATLGLGERATTIRPTGKIAAIVSPATRILVAEDHSINQKVLLLMLRKLGLDADVVANGREAVEAVARQSYDLILMDLQMPGMDGLEATRRIREMEAEDHRTRIIAMTAHALRGTREQCLKAGMDLYLTKPVRLEDLQRLFTAAPIPEPKEGSESAETTIDRDRLAMLRRLEDGDSEQLVEPLIRSFFERSTADLASLREATAARDWASLQTVAHGLKGKSSNLGAVGVTLACTAIEATAGERRFDEMEELLAGLELEIDRAREELEAVFRSEP